VRIATSTRSVYDIISVCNPGYSFIIFSDVLIGSSVPNEASAIEAFCLYATKPRMAGSPGDLTTAKDFYTSWRQLGIKPPSTEPIFAAGSPESQHATRSISKTHQPRAWIDT